MSENRNRGDVLKYFILEDTEAIEDMESINEFDHF